MNWRCGMTNLRMLVKLLSAALLVAVPALACAAAPSQIHLSWQGPTDTTMTVTWRSSDATGSVDYGTSSGYGQSAAATSTSYGGSYLHIAQLTGLTPGTSYHYRCGTGTSWAADATFATAPAPGTAFRFVAWGDSRTDNTTRGLVRAAVEARQPAFTVDTGDLVDSGGTQSLWDQYFATLQSLAATAPLMPTVGNHEANASQYFTQFALPKHPTASGYNDEAYYSFNYANVHFVALTTESTVGGAQLSWLKDDLAAAKANSAIRFIVVYAHQPPFSSGSHGSNSSVRSTWGPVFEQYGVDITFWGHDHDYERTKPLLGGAPVTSGGVTYVVTGGAGAPLYNVASNPWTAFSKSDYHFVEVNVSANELRMEAKDLGGATFDSFTITKSAASGSGGGTTDPGTSGNPGASGSAQDPAAGDQAGAPAGGCNVGLGSALPLGFLPALLVLTRRRRSAGTR